jgi:hypothetical protein
MMHLTELKAVLAENPRSLLRFRLPNGSLSAPHAHITEVGLVTKSFIDCGGTIRSAAYCLLQSWVADDVDHRLQAGKLLSIIEKASPLLGTQDPLVELEHQLEHATQLSVIAAAVQEGEVVLQLAGKRTACLAPEICCPTPPGEVTVPLSRRL